MEPDVTIYPVWMALAIVIAAIVIDTLLAVFISFRADTENFDFRLLPRFVAHGVFPYVGGLTLLAVVADMVGEPFLSLFYPAVAAVMLKYLVEVKDKISALFGIDLQMSKKGE